MVSSTDRPGLVAATSRAVTDGGGNIVHAEQHADSTHGVFLQRIDVACDDPERLQTTFATFADANLHHWSCHPAGERIKAAVFVSRTGHCGYDLFARATLDELAIDPVALVSDYEDHRDLARRFDVPFLFVASVGDTTTDRTAHEAEITARLNPYQPELLVLARYMRILTPSFCETWSHRAINIHHSFLPAFSGASAYRQAYDRGVKLIGATAHYVTADLDEGPIIAQDTISVSHRDDVADLVRKGRDLETRTLARAVRAHTERRVIAYANRTAVFDG